MSELYLYPGSQPSLQLSITTTLRRLAKVTDMCDVEVSDSLAFLATPARLYCVQCPRAHLLWNCVLPTATCRLWTTPQFVWSADRTGLLVSISANSQTITQYIFGKTVTGVFDSEGRLYSVLEDGSIFEKVSEEWVTPNPAPLWAREIQSRSNSLKQVLGGRDPTLVTDFELRVWTGQQWDAYRSEGQIIHVLRVSADSFTILVQKGNAQRMEQVQRTEKGLVVSRRSELSGTSLVKLLGGNYVLEYSNACFCLAELSMDESLARLKGLLQSGNFSEAEPLLMELEDRAVPLLRHLFESISVQQVPSLLKLATHLSPSTLTILCTDLLTSPPTQPECALDLFKGAQALLNAMDAPVLSQVSQQLAIAIHKTETFRIAKPWLACGFPEFLHRDIREEVRELFAQGRLSQGLFLVRRHSSEVGDCVQLLTSLPNQFLVRDLLAWIEKELLPLLDEAQLQQLESWLELRARGLADVDVSQAYRLAMASSVLLKNPVSVTGARLLPLAQQHRLLPDLGLLQAQLHAFLDLRDHYRLVLSFNDFLRLSPEEVAEQLLLRLTRADQVHLELQKCFLPYVQHQGWKSDLILLNFLLKRPALPDSVLLALVQSLHDDESKGRAAEYLLESASPGLSTELRALLHTFDPRGTNKALATQLLLAEAAELQQELPLLQADDKHQMTQLLRFLAERQPYLVSHLADTLDYISPETLLENHIFLMVNQGTPSKIVVPGDLKPHCQRNAVQAGFQYCLGLLRQKAEVPAHLRSLTLSQVTRYERGLGSLEYLGQLLAQLLDEERYTNLVKGPLRALPHLRRLARNYQLYLSPEEWSSRQVATEVLTSIIAVQHQLSEKRTHPPEASQKRSKTNLSHLTSLLGLPRVKLPALPTSSDLQIQLADLPSLHSYLQTCPSSELKNAVRRTFLCDLALRVSKLAGLQGSYLAVDAQLYRQWSGRFVYCEEAMHVSERAYSNFLMIAQTVLQHNSPRDLLDWAVTNRSTLTLLPFLRPSLSQAESDSLTEALALDMLRAREVDESTALSLLVALPSARGFEVLAKACSAPDNTLEINQSITALAVSYAVLSRSSELREAWVLREANFKWQHTLNSLAISFDPEAFGLKPRLAVLSDLVPMLMHKSRDYDLVLDFCRTYGLEELEAVNAFVELHVLDVVVRSELQGRLADPPECLAGLLGSSPFDSTYQDNIRAVIAHVPKDRLIPVLQRCMQRILQTDYPRVHFIFSLFLESGLSHFQKHKQSTQLLMDFRRSAPPTSEELSTLREFQRNYRPELANLCEALYLTKLPLDSLFTCPKETLLREVSLRTLDSLLPVGALYRLEPDLMRLTAIKNEISQHQHPQPCSTCPSLSAFKSVLSKLRNFQDKHDLALKVLHFFPISDDHVSAANFLRTTDALWLESVPSEGDLRLKVQNLLRESEKSAKQAALQFELKEYGLLDKFGCFTGAPAELVSQLLCSLGPECSLGEEEMWSLVTAIAKRSDLDLDELLERLVLSWVALRGEISVQRAYALRESSGEVAEQRFQFLARHWNLFTVVAALLRFQEPEAHFTRRTRTEALGLLLRVCPPADLEQLLPPERLGTTVGCYYQYSCYLVDLEEMRIPYSMEALLRCDISAFVKGLLATHQSESRAVQLAACLACDFSLSESDLLTCILDLLLAQQDDRLACSFLHTLALRGVLNAQMAPHILDALLGCVNRFKTSYSLDVSGQINAIVAVVELVDPPLHQLCDLARQFIDGFFPGEAMEAVVPACVRLIRLVTVKDILEKLATDFAERFAGLHPVQVVAALQSYVGEEHPLQNSLFKVEEAGNFEPLLRHPDLMQYLSLFLIRKHQGKRLVKLVTSRLGRAALADLTNMSDEAVVQQVMQRLCAP